MAKVPFTVNDIEVDGTTLTVDEANNRVGVGTDTPGETLDVVGTFKASDGVITLTTAGTPSASLADGALAVDTTNDKFFIRSGTEWVEVGGGVSDHGGLTGLADDDHTQYPRLTASDTAPSSPRANDLWYHTERGKIYVYYDSFWVESATEVADISRALATGGTVLDDETYIYHTFTSSDSFVLNSAGTLTINYLIVAGGGAGGNNVGGGGGAGGVLTGSTSITSTQTVTIGAGGAGSGSANAKGGNGSNSLLGALTAIGGGGGSGRVGSSGTAAGNGGSGGGGGIRTTGDYGTGTSGQGYDGGAGSSNSSYDEAAGGGGAGGVGESTDNLATKSGDGGPGIEWPTGSGVYYGGGGAGGTFDGNNPGVGGVGGGGDANDDLPGDPGSSNTGGGGAGGGGGNSSGGNGGSGVVIIRYNPSTDWVAD